MRHPLLALVGMENGFSTEILRNDTCPKQKFFILLVSVLHQNWYGESKGKNER
jgi:hypothetical protein